MKRLFLLVCVLALALGAMSCALAGPDDEWTVLLRPRTSTGAIGQTGAFGTKPLASDGIDPYDATLPASGDVFIASTDLGQLYYKDFREPLGWDQTKTWHLKLWLSENTAATGIQLSGWSVGLNGLLPVRLEVVSPGMTYAFDSTAPGTGDLPAFTWQLDGANHRGFSNAIELRLIAGPAVPEPASLAALLCGLVGLAGWVRGRR